MNFLKAFFGLSILLLTGCVTETVKNGTNDVEQADAMRRASVVTMGTPLLDPAKPSSISWKGALSVMGAHPVLSSEQVQQQITGLIEQTISEKGYVIKQNAGDFQLEATLVLANDESADKLLSQRMGMDPGLAGAGDDVAKGTLILTLKQGRAVRWRGSVQIFMAAQYEPKLGSTRTAYAVQQLLNTWP